MISRSKGGGGGVGIRRKTIGPKIVGNPKVGGEYNGRGYFRMTGKVFVTLEGFSNINDVEALPMMDMWISGQRETYKTYTIEKIEQLRNTRGGRVVPRSQEIEIHLESKTVDSFYVEDTNLEIDLWTHARNDHGIWCKMPAGSASLSLSKLVAACRSAGSTTEVIDMDIPKADNEHKASIYLNVKKEDIVMNNIAFVSAPPGLAASMRRDEIDVFLKNSAGPLEDMNNGVTLYAMNDVVSMTHLQNWRTRHGDLPPEMYWVDPLWATHMITGKDYFNEQKMLIMFRHMMEHVLYINSFDEAKLVQIARAQFAVGTVKYIKNFTYITFVLAEMLSFYSNCCPYVGDFLHHGSYMPGNGNSKQKVMIESFDDLFRRRSGDCEDLARATGMFINWFRKIRTSEREHGLLHYLHMTLEVYVDMGVLANVTSAALNDGNEDESKWGAHMYGILIPSPVFYDMARRGTPNRQMIRKIHVLMKIETTPRWTRDLPILFLEGTGRMVPGIKSFRDYFPGQKEEEVFRARRLSAFTKLRSSVDGFRKGLFASYMEQTRVQRYDVDYDLHKNGNHLFNFYRTCNQGYSSYFMQKGLLCGRWVFMDQSTPNELMYSVHMEDLIYNKPHVAIYMCSPMSRECFAQSMHMLHYHLSPTPLLQYSENGVYKHIQCNRKDLELLGEIIERHTNSSSSSSSSNGGNQTVDIDVFVLPSQLTPEIINHFKSQINRDYKKLGIVAVEYRVMCVSKDVGTVCIRFKCIY